MARLRYALLAYAQQGDAPEVILAKLSQLVRIEDTDHFATVVCALLDVERHQLTVANAGHLPPLLVGGSASKYLTSGIGLPVGLSDRAAYEPISVTVPSMATLLAFTDGLIERRAEAIDVSLKRFADAVVVDVDRPVDQLLAALVEDFTRDGIDDDAAILGVRWLT
jgi:serine phosphatase RsbU (regulator of sigma subunit)